MLPEGGHLPEPKSGLLFSTQKWIVLILYIENPKDYQKITRANQRI